MIKIRFYLYHLLIATACLTIFSIIASADENNSKPSQHSVSNTHDNFQFQDFGHSAGTNSPSPMLDDFHNGAGTNSPSPMLDDFHNGAGTNSPSPMLDDFHNGAGTNSPSPMLDDFHNGAGFSSASATSFFSSPQIVYVAKSDEDKTNTTAPAHDSESSIVAESSSVAYVYLGKCAAATDKFSTYISASAGIDINCARIGDFKPVDVKIGNGARLRSNYKASAPEIGKLPSGSVVHLRGLRYTGDLDAGPIYLWGIVARADSYRAAAPHGNMLV